VPDLRELLDKEAAMREEMERLEVGSEERSAVARAVDDLDYDIALRALDAAPAFLALLDAAKWVSVFHKWAVKRDSEGATFSESFDCWREVDAAIDALDAACAAARSATGGEK